MKRTVLITLATLSASLLAFAGEAEPKPPFVGEVAGDRVRIRGGDGITYMVLANPEPGERVLVKERRFGWLAIAVPETCTVWVHKTMLTMGPKGAEATVGRDKVNVRARAAANADVLGQLSRGQRVKVVDEDGDWAGIAPPPQVRAWVHSRFIRKVADKPAPKPVPKAGMDRAASVALLRKAASMYRAELAKPAKERSFDAVLGAYQKVAAKCQDKALAQRAERARQRLLKIVDLIQLLRAARKPIEEFEKKYDTLEAEYKRRAQPARRP